MQSEQQCDVEPQFGYVIVSREIQDKTGGGIVIPGTVDMVRYKVIASSEGYMDGGQLVRSQLQPGDEVVLAPNGTATAVVKGQPPHQVPKTRLLHSPLLAEGHFIALLQDVACRVPAAKVRSYVAEEPTIVKPQIAVVKH
jgi:co-chaperonin GroES (HSP10)